MLVGISIQVVDDLTSFTFSSDAKLYIQWYHYQWKLSYAILFNIEFMTLQVIA